MNIIAILLGLILGFGCAKKIGPIPPIVHRGTYTYQQLDPNTFVIMARNQEALDMALREISCGLCSIEFNGTSFIVRKLQP